MKNIKINSIKFNGEEVIVSLELPLRGERDKVVTFCTSEVIELLRTEKKITVKDIITVNSISNVTENTRKGKWIFIGESMDIPKKEKWLYKNKEALASVKEGLAQAAKGYFFESPLVESKSVQRRKKAQKKEE